jgi:glycosyltransferase involved in cell wall biosynthesis
MKVLHLSSGNLYGGIETVLVTLARERRQCPDLKPHFAVCFEDRFSRELRATGAPVDYLGNVRTRNPFTVLRARAALDRLLAQESIDIAICHGPWPHAVFSPVVKDRRIPLVFWAHGLAGGRHWLEIWARQTPPALVICNSRTTQSSVGRLFPNIPTQVVYAPVSNSAHIHLPTPEAQPLIIIQVSRMEAWKGHRVLLEALSLLKDLPDWLCWVVGGAQTDRETKYEDGLHRLSEKLSLSDRVDFLGQRDDVPELLAQAGIFCQPNTEPEPFGIVYIEALQTSLPIVATNLGGAAEIVDSTCGLLVPPDDPAALATALRSLITDPALRQRLSQSGPARAQALCDPARQLGKLHSALQALF